MCLIYISGNNKKRNINAPTQFMFQRFNYSVLKTRRAKKAALNNHAIELSLNQGHEY